MSFKRQIDQDWQFTQIGGGQGTKDGEWLKASEFPTTVHVELLKQKIIPDPVGVIIKGSCPFISPSPSSWA
jgi:beta-mannosidase